MNGKAIAPVLFVALYVTSIMAVCIFNASAILRDAVVGVPLVAGIYMMFLLPTCAAGAVAVALPALEGKQRLGLAVSFAALLALFLEGVFYLAGTQHFGPAVMESGTLLMIGGNVVLASAFLVIGLIASKQARRASPEAT